MLRFCGFDLELLVYDTLSRGEWPSVALARDPSGDQWLIVLADDHPDHLTWMCARVTEMAIRAVIQGQASPADALTHSATGIVELITVDHGRVVPDRCVLAANVANLLVRGTGTLTTVWNEPTQ